MYRATAQEAPLLITITGNSVAALDRRNGKAVWSFRLAENNRRQRLTPRLWVEQERVIVISSSDMKGAWSAEVYGVVTCLDYRTGHVIWQQTFDADVNAAQFYPTVLVDGGQLLVAMTAHVFAFSLENGAMQWGHRGETSGAYLTSTALALPGLVAQADRS